MHRGVHTLSQRATDAYEARARDGARLHQRRARRARSSSCAARPKRSTWSRRATCGRGLQRRRRDPDHRAGAPRQHRAVAAGLPSRPARSCKVDSDQRSAAKSISLRSSALIGPRTRLLALAHVSNALGTIVPVARDHRARARHRRSRAARRRTGRAAPASSTCRRSIAISTAFSGAQDVRPDRHRRALRARAAARSDAAVARRRRHDPVGHFREDDVQPAAVEVRGRHAAHRRRDRHGAPRSTICKASAWSASPRTSTSCSTTRRRGWPSIPGLRIIGTAPQKASVRVVHDRRHSSARHRHDSRHARASRCARDITARCR